MLDCDLLNKNVSYITFEIVIFFEEEATRPNCIRNALLYSNGLSALITYQSDSTLDVIIVKVTITQQIQTAQVFTPTSWIVLTFT